jgi:hypothetical protein
MNQNDTQTEVHNAVTAELSTHLSQRLNEIGLYVEQLQQHVYLHCRLDTPVPGCTFCDQQQTLQTAIKTGAAKRA